MKTIKDTRDVIACVVDNGIFLPVARRLGKDFRKVYYYSPHEKAFPTVRDCIGDGFDEVERIKSVWEVASECDLFVFPDIGNSELQLEITRQGKPVWGARRADKLETSRGFFLTTLADTDLPLPNYRKINGITDLRNHLIEQEDKWIKISFFRGDFETMHFRNWKQDESTLDAIAVKLGPWKEQISFYVFDPIETNIEDGYDGYCIDGKWPGLCVRGMECKDRAYLGAFQSHDELPEEVRKVNDAFGPILRKYGYRSFFSAEVRVTDTESYFIDPTCRAGSPPSQVQTEMFGNYGEIIWRGASGECIDPEPVKKFGVQALLTVKSGRQNWCAVEIPEEIKQWVKCGFCSEIDGRLVFPPDPENHTADIGWLVAIGDSPAEAIESIKEHAERLPDGVCASIESLADLIMEADEAREQGMELTDQPMPRPDIVLTNG